MKVRKQSEAGNILFLILLAVALFAALSYAVTSSIKGGTKDASSENWQAAAADLLQQMSQVDLALSRMQMTGGLRPEDISFETTSLRYDGATVSWANSNCTNNTCKLFNVNGGNAVDRAFTQYGTPSPAGWTGTNMAPGYWDLMVMQWPEAKTTANDIVMRYAALRPGLCDAINAALGITAIPVVTGTYVSGANVSQWDNAARSVTTNASQLTGKNTFAAATSGSGDNAHCTIYRLVIAR